MLHAPLVIATAKLDISLLLESSPSPPPTSPAPTTPPLLRSTSVPAAVSHRPPTSSSQPTSIPSVVSSSASQSAPSPPTVPYSQTQRQYLPALNTSSARSSSYLSPRSAPQTLAPHQPSAKRPPPSVPHPSALPAKRQSKWTPEEDTLIITLRAPGMKWEDISQRLPGRSAISCRLHYQNYLERRSDWDEEKKNRLARLYERYVALPWRYTCYAARLCFKLSPTQSWIDLPGFCFVLSV